MKKTCRGCRAISGDNCSLGFKNEGFDRLNGNYKPLEDCPKPKTNKEYIKIYNQRRENL